MEEFERMREITKKINEIMAGRAKANINTSERVFGRDPRLEKYVCRGCAFQDNYPLGQTPWYPCDICTDRPSRAKDRSQFMMDYTDEQRAKQKEENIKEQERKGQYDY